MATQLSSLIPGTLPTFTFTNYTGYNYIGITNDGNYIFVNTDTKIDIFSASSYMLLKTISANNIELRQPIFSKDGKYVYYVDLGTNAVYIIDTYFLDLIEVFNIPTTTTTPLNGTAYFMGTLSNDGKYLYVYPDSAYFYALQLQNDLPTGTIYQINTASGYPLMGLGVGLNNYVYALGTNSGYTESVISVIDPSTGNIVNTITVYNNASGSTDIDYIYFLPNSNTAYVRDSYNGNMYVIDTSKNILVNTYSNLRSYYTSTSDGTKLFGSGLNNSLNNINNTTVFVNVRSYAITLTNSQSSATPTPFQQLINIDPATIGSSYFSSDLGNIRFYADSAFTQPLYAWVESGNSNTSTSTNIWVNLPNGIPANSSITIYMQLLPVGTEYDGVYMGEAPQLSSSYALYDNGTNVFSFYDNFAGTTLNTNKWLETITEGSPTVTVNNGITLSSPPSSGVIISAKPSFSISTIFEGLWVSYSKTGGGPGSQLGVGLNSTNMDSAYYWFCNGSFYYGETNASGSGASHSYRESFKSIFGVSWVATGTEIYYNNDSVAVNWNDTSNTIGTSYYGYLNAGPGGYTVTVAFTYARARAYPPNNTMPSTSIAFYTTNSIPQQTYVASAIIPITFDSMPTPTVPMAIDPTNTYMYILYNVGHSYCVYDTPILKMAISNNYFYDVKTYRWTVYINEQANGVPVCAGSADYILSTDNLYSQSIKLPNGNYYFTICPEPRFMVSYSGSFSVYFGTVTINTPLPFISCFG